MRFFSTSTQENEAPGLKMGINLNAFGAPMPERSFNTQNYRYGYNGHERDDEVSGSGNHLSWGDYGYDPRLGRRWNIDPQWQRLPGQSPYSANNNSPIQYTDPDGELGFLGAAIGAVVGAVAEVGSQVVSNVVQGKPAFKKIDWADVAISAGEGALAGATGGVSLLATGGFEAAKASIDYTREDGFSSVGGVIGNKKDLSQAGIDFAGGIVGFGAGKLLPVGDMASDAVAGQFVKNGIKSEAQFLTGMITSDLAGGLTNSVIGGTASGLFNRGIDALQNSGSGEGVGGMPTIMLPEVEISVKRNEVTPEGKITPKGENKIHKHIEKNVK